MTRIRPDLVFERELWKSGLKYIAGLDEAGRGALAGPVAVGAVILPNDPSLLLGHRFAKNRRTDSRRLDGGVLSAVRDSKQMTTLQRECTAPRIKQFALAWGVGFASSDEIDSDGIVRATRLAALRALQELPVYPDYLLTDFRLELPQLDISQTALVKGDVHCLSIAAASVLAKTTRDALMVEMDAQVPGYGLGKHKGYGTLAHRQAVVRLGCSPIHRKSFSIKL
jgi:ribonuclease HII